MKYKLATYYEDPETKKKMDLLLPKQKTSFHIRKWTKRGIKEYEKNYTKEKKDY